MAGRGPPREFEERKLIRLTTEQLAAIQAYATSEGITDSEAIRRLIDAGLLTVPASKPKRTPKPAKRSKPAR
jgi:hypothetical protein